MIDKIRNLVITLNDVSSSTWAMLMIFLAAFLYAIKIHDGALQLLTGGFALMQHSEGRSSAAPSS